MNTYGMNKAGRIDCTSVEPVATIDDRSNGELIYSVSVVHPEVTGAITFDTAANENNEGWTLFELAIREHYGDAAWIQISSRIHKFSSQRLKEIDPGWKDKIRKNFGDDSADEMNDAPLAAMRRASDIEVKAIEWAWYRKVAFGKLNLFAGEPGCNKSTLTIDWAAHITTGSPWPDGSPCERGSVIFVSVEDDPADTIVPRLIAAGADISQIHFLEGTFVVNDKGGKSIKSFTVQHLHTLEDAINRTGCKLLVIDPISACLDGKDSHNNSDIRALLSPLAMLAARYGVCAILVTHLNKGTAAKAMHRAMASIAFIAQCRSAWLVSKDPQNNRRRYFLPIKNNLGDDATGHAFTVESSDSEMPYVAWEAAPVTMTADQALAASEAADDPKAAREAPARDAAVDWLLALLKDGPVAVEDIKNQANESGTAWATLRRAKDTLGIKPRKSQFNGPWVWALPASAAAKLAALEASEPTCSPSCSPKVLASPATEQHEHVEQHEHLLPSCSKTNDNASLEGAPA